MASYIIHNLSVTRVDDCTHFSGIVGNGPYPSSQEVSELPHVGDQNAESIGIDLGSVEIGLSGRANRLVI